MEFFRQEYWNKSPFSIPRDLPNPGMKPCPLWHLQSAGGIFRMPKTGSHSVVSNSLWPHGHGLYSPWNSLGQNTGVGSHSLLQGIFPIQGSNPGLPHCGQILYQLSHKGSPRILEWVAYLFCSRSSLPSNRTGVSCIAGRFFTNWAMREALTKYLRYQKIRNLCLL